MTIQQRLSLWYMGITFAILLTFSLGTYFGMRHLLYSALDEERDLIAQAVQGSYDPVTRTFNSRMIQPLQTRRHLQEQYVVIYDSFEQPVFQSSLAERMEMAIPLSKSLRGERQTVRMKNNEPQADEKSARLSTFRTFSRKIIHQQQTVGWVNIALPTNNIEDSMRNLLNILLLGVVLTVLLIGAGSFFLTRKAMQPVAAITSKAQQISSTSLDKRLQVYNARDELGQLTIVLNKLLARLQESFESQKRFMADAAHELRTPLAVLRAHWEDEINNETWPLAVRQKLAQNAESVSRMNHLINNMLLLSRTEGLKLECRRLVLADLIAEVVDDARILADTKQQQVEVVADEAIIISADHDRLYHLFFNLVENAGKYTQTGGRVTLTISHKQDSAEVAVKDNGPGIPEADLPRIFDRFYRVNKDRSRRTGGSGLGLAICKVIAEAHNGFVTAHNNPGAGTTFCVQLPLADR